jgi:nucleotide-binding universal stress UspA family protein
MSVDAQDEQTMDRSVTVVGIDFSDTSRHLVFVASNLARATRGLDIHLVHVLRPPAAAISGSIAYVRYEWQIAAAKRQLEELTVEVSRRGSFRTFHHLRTGEAHREIVELASDLGADLVIIGTHGHSGFSRLLLGSIAERVQRFAPCPVLTVKPKAPLQASDLEPPCPSCRVARIESYGADLWCEEHQLLVEAVDRAPESDGAVP